MQDAKKNKVDSKSLSEALDILERAAKENSRDFVSELKPEFDRLKKLWSEFGPAVAAAKDNVVESGRDAAVHAVDAGREALQKVNQRAKEEPWMLAGVIGLFGLAVGFMLGRGRNE